MFNWLRRLFHRTGSGGLAGAPITWLQQLQNRIGNPDAHTLVSLTAKLGNLARSLTTILGTRWNSSGDLGTDIAAIVASTGAKAVGVTQVFQKSVTSAANTNGLVTLATITTAACLIKSIVVKAVTAVQTDLTSAAVKGGASQVITFLSATDAAVINITSIDQQVSWTGAVELAATKTIVMDVEGTGATAINLLVTIEFEACVDAGYLA